MCPCGAARLVVGWWQVGQRPFGKVGCCFRFGGALVGLLHQHVVEPEAEQLLQEGLAIGGLVVQEPGEVALRQHDTAREVVEAQAEQPLDGGPEVARGLGHDVDLAVRAVAFEPRPSWWPDPHGR